MRPLLLKCPSCNGDLSVSRLNCPECSIAIEGDFSFPALLRLNRAQLDFVEVFLKNRGIIREVERELGVSYPTVRARLDEVIEALGFKVDGPALADDRGDRRTVLEELRAGRITAEEAMRSLGAKPAARSKEKPDREEPENG